MSVPSGPILLDTNVVVRLARNDWLGQRIDEAYGLRNRKERPLLSIVSVGELLSLASQWRWAEKKVQALRALIGELVVLDLQRQLILDQYAAIDAHCKGKGIGIGNNDVWIAATASAAGAVLLTTDRDFDPLDPAFLRRIWIDSSPPNPQS